MVGQIGAIAADPEEEDSRDGYYLVEFMGLPYTEQTENGSLKCRGRWVHELDRAKMWFYKSEDETVIDMVNVVETDVIMEPFAPDNMPKFMRKQAQDLCALRIDEGSHNIILDEIWNRERLEYDPSRVFAAEEEDEVEEDMNCESDDSDVESE
jgi:hypothetical protein